MNKSIFRGPSHMAQHPTNPMISERESDVLSFVNDHPLAAWLLLAVLVALAAALICSMPGEW